jgi:Adenylylsulfate kinase and related kinases
LAQQRGREHLYISARQGKIKNVLGVDIDFPEPVSPDLVIDNEEHNEDF